MCRFLTRHTKLCQNFAETLLRLCQNFVQTLPKLCGLCPRYNQEPGLESGLGCNLGLEYSLRGLDFSRLFRAGEWGQCGGPHSLSAREEYAMRTHPITYIYMYNRLDSENVDLQINAHVKMFPKDTNFAVCGGTTNWISWSGAARFAAAKFLRRNTSVQLLFTELRSEILRVLLRRRMHYVEPKRAQSAPGLLGMLPRLPAGVRRHRVISATVRVVRKAMK